MPRNISQIVDEQIKRWNMEQKAQKQKPKAEVVPQFVITVSREFGANGRTVAARLGEMLGIPVYDREIVEHIATTKNVRVEAVESLDERALGAVDDYLVNLFRERNFDEGDYMQALTRTIASLWAHGSCVFVGRGAANIISRRYALAVRLVAPRQHRLRRAEDLTGLSRKRAERYLDRVDAERASFVRRMFGQDIGDPLCYDLLVNMGGLTTDAAAKLVVEAFKCKFPEVGTGSCPNWTLPPPP